MEFEYGGGRGWEFCIAHDRVAAAEKGGKASKSQREHVEGSEFARRQAQRKAWEGEVEGVSELLDGGASPSTDSDTIEGSESGDDSVDSVDDELDI